MSSTSRTLKTVVFMGSSRNTKMPFGHGRERLGTGVWDNYLIIIHRNLVYYIFIGIKLGY